MQRPVAGGAVQAGVLKSEIPGALQRYPLEDYVEVEPPYQFNTGYQVDTVSFVLYAVVLTAVAICAAFGLKYAATYWQKRKDYVRVEGIEMI